MKHPGQGRKAFQWLQRQVERQLPGPHFMLTFTVPEALRTFLMGQPRFGYDCLFRASADAMKVLVADPRHLGAEHPGFFGVLHTWGRQLQYHPHIHGPGLLTPPRRESAENESWRGARTV